MDTEITPKILDAKIHNLKFWISESKPDLLHATFQYFLEQVGFSILNCIEHHFPQQGYTVFWLLAESHLAIHTFPDKKKAYVELSSCNLQKSSLFKQLLVKNKLQIDWESAEEKTF